MRTARPSPARWRARRTQGGRPGRARHRHRPDHRCPSREFSASHRKLRRSARLVGESRLPTLPALCGSDRVRDADRAIAQGRSVRPILHVCTYRRDDLGSVLRWLSDIGYGLTLGIHSRIQGFVDEVVREARVGNIYVNRSMIGAVVGVQPFGGEGLSGTGPKAGGPHHAQVRHRENADRQHRCARRRHGTARGQVVGLQSGA